MVEQNYINQEHNSVEETGFYRDIYILLLTKQQPQKMFPNLFMYNCATYAILDIFSSNFKSNPYIKYVQNCKFGRRHEIVHSGRQCDTILRFLI
jgi:hypothetical protein